MDRKDRVLKLNVERERGVVIDHGKKRSRGINPPEPRGPFDVSFREKDDVRWNGEKKEWCRCSLMEQSEWDQLSCPIVESPSGVSGGAAAAVRLRLVSQWHIVLSYISVLTGLGNNAKSTVTTHHERHCFKGPKGLNVSTPDMSILSCLRIPGTPATNPLHAILCIKRTIHLQQRCRVMEG